METFIKLINEYEVEKEKSERTDVDIYVEFEWGYTDYNWLTRWDKTDQWEWDNLYWDTAVAYLISKSFWFVKRLVENDKIDIRKLEDKDAEYSFHYSFEDYEVLLMLLSISDTPIEFLCSILK